MTPQTGEPRLEQVFWQVLQPHGEPMLKQSFPEGLYPREETHAGLDHEELQPMGRTQQERCSWRTVCHGMDLTVEQRKSMKSPLSEEEGVAETRCDE